jgi:acyl carrier protein
MDKLLDIINLMRTNKGAQPLFGLSPDLNLRTDIGFDSLDLAEFTVRIEKQYGTDIFEDSFVYTIGEVLSKLSAS